MIDRRGLIAGALSAAPVTTITPATAGSPGAARGLGEGQDLQQRLDSAMPGSVMPLPVATYVSPEGGFVQTRDLSWRLDPGAESLGDHPRGDDGSLLTVRIDGYGRQGDFRGGFLTGGRFLVSHPDDGSGRAEPSARLGRGGYAIDIRATGPGLNILNYRISQASMSGGTGAVRFIGAGFGQTVAWSGVEASTLINGVVCDQTADGMMFRDNIADGVQPAYRLDLLEGAFCCTIDGGSTANRDGALDVVNGSMWRSCRH
jgi:hypothetical protein